VGIRRGLRARKREEGLEVWERVNGEKSISVIQIREGLFN